MNASPSPTAPTGLRLWLLIAVPLLLQFGTLALGASIVKALTSEPRRDTTLTNLPQSVLMVVAYLVFAAAIWLVAKRLGAPLSILALRRVPLRRGLLLGGGGLLAGLVASALLEPIFHGSSSQGIEAGTVDSLASAVALALSAIAIVGGAALTEELYFRGLLYGRLDARFGVASAVVGSAGLFGLVHFQPNAFPTLLALGLILGLVRMRSSSVWPGVGIHAANNVIAVVGLLLATQ
jgi:membrane protease YdiL (CAAX protease family)